MVEKEAVQVVPSRASAEPAQITTFKAYLFILLVLSAITVCVIWQLPMHSAIFLSLLSGAVIAFWSGFTWPMIQNMMFDSIKESLVLIMLMLLIGIVIGLWIISGVVPSMVYYGIKLLNPRTFLILAPLFTALVALSIGTAFGTVSTIGLAMMSIGLTMGINPELLAASLIGALFCGELLSPVAGSVNLNIALFKIDLLPYLRKVRVPIFASFALSMMLNLFFAFQNQQASEPTVILEVMTHLTNNYQINWFLLIIPIIIILLSWRGFQTLPVLSVGAFLGILAALLIQKTPIKLVLNAIYSGPPVINDHYILTGLTNNGGLVRMMSLVTLIIMSLALAGLLEKTGALKAVTHRLLLISEKSKSHLMGFAIGCGGLLAFVAGSQTLAMILTNKVVIKSFKHLEIDQAWGSAAIAAGAGSIPALIPWNACGLFLTNILGVATVHYLPYSVFILSLPLTTFTYFLFLTRKEADIRED